MTCKEKLIQDNPNLDKWNIDEIIDDCCPHHYGYSHDDRFCGENYSDCTACWNQEVIEIKKENKPMTNTKKTKTKTQLIEELEAAKTNVADLKKQIDNLEKYKQYEQCADEIKAMHTAFMNSGFTNEQAFDLIKTAMNSVAGAMFKK